MTPKRKSMTKSDLFTIYVKKKLYAVMTFYTFIDKMKEDGYEVIKGSSFKYFLKVTWFILTTRIRDHIIE